jgi:hypothetical protein
VESRAEKVEAECFLDGLRPLDLSWGHSEGATMDVMVVSRDCLAASAAEACYHKNDGRKHEACQVLILEALPVYAWVLLQGA